MVAVFGNKVERCFDIVAGVDRALVFTFSFIHSFIAFGTTARAAYDPGYQEAIHDDKNF